MRREEEIPANGWVCIVFGGVDQIEGDFLRVKTIQRIVLIEEGYHAFAVPQTETGGSLLKAYFEKPF